MQFVLGAFFNGQPVKFSANERDVILSLSFSVSLLSLSLSLSLVFRDSSKCRIEFCAACGLFI